MADASGKRVAVLVDNYFEEDEFTGPIAALRDAGARVEVIAAGPQDGEVQALRHVDKGGSYKIDKTLDKASLDDYDAVVLPGGAVNADHLRMQPKAREWVRGALDAAKPLAVICHAPWVLASAGVAQGKTLTSYYTIQDDMRNAGSTWLDEPVVVDDTLITSRNPGDVPAFNHELIAMLSE